jgi:transposase
MPAKQYRTWSPAQSFLLPPSPLEWLPSGHLAYMVLDVVNELDLRAIENAIEEKDARGTRPYAPRMMTALLLYAYCAGTYSSRKIARGTYEDVALRVLAGGEHPHFTTVNEFRLEHRKALAGLFQQVLSMCRRAGLVSLGHVSIDGSKVQANASKHKAMSYKRMNDDETRLQREVETLLAQADAIDRKEDVQYGVGVDPQDLPQELQRREDRLARIREAKAALEKEAAQTRATALEKQAAVHRERAATDPDPTVRKCAEALAAKRTEQAKELRDDDEDPPTAASNEGLPLHRVPTTPSGAPKDKAQRNFTDPDSRIMQRNGAFMQAFNCQIAVEHSNQIIVAEAVSNQAPDAEYLAPVLARTIDAVGAPVVVSADAGYYSDANVAMCRAAGVEPFLAVGRSAHQHRENETPSKTGIGSETRAAMRESLLGERGRDLYKRRKAIVEPPFAHIKSVRGFTRFSLRGLSKVASEWSIVCLCHNLLKLFSATGQRQAAC